MDSDICLQSDMYRFVFRTYGLDLYIEQLAHREMVGRGRTFLTVDQEACVVSGMTDIIQSHIVYDTGGLAGMIIADPEMIRSASRIPGGVGCQAECVTGIGFATSARMPMSALLISLDSRSMI